MPLDDWTRVPDNVFHHFHTEWLVHLSRALNEGLLPVGYYARTEEYVGPFQANVLTLESGEGSPTGLSGSSTRGGERDTTLSPTATIAPPHFGTWRKRRVSVFSARDERRVAVLEVVSPGNKDSQERARQFREKLLECLAAGLHVLVVDLLPSTAPEPGIAASVARELGSDDVPAGGRHATSFEVQREPPTVRVYHQALVLGRALPPTPLFLEPGVHVSVPLEDSYARSVSGLPGRDLRQLRGEP